MIPKSQHQLPPSFLILLHPSFSSYQPPSSPTWAVCFSIPLLELLSQFAPTLVWRYPCSSFSFLSSAGVLPSLPHQATLLRLRLQPFVIFYPRLRLVFAVFHLSPPSFALCRSTSPPVSSRSRRRAPLYFSLLRSPVDVAVQEAGHSLLSGARPTVDLSDSSLTSMHDKLVHFRPVKPSRSSRESGSRSTVGRFEDKTQREL
ncbi:hypothetical protein AUEXF2481DRAFT_410219 [Aureobasidium subglaciale EXF-2481]|uniref:Uncharacterized protein n=1 Tax=Aureobasidium subglaciale (strain EXF-2481) TaxID=1043005 RepID=A0A074ZLH9_AURSE|nr:uncharacterized protein AUEXF2481DRAFT_410219 [Aureobasidium subglaciale EXF-2481]KEQ99271.1 hypothetical protein AUEXF2481DRAFT_410219 [Aureobasidium subglaciale EXF-2481]